MKDISDVIHTIDGFLLQRFQLLINVFYDRFGWSKFTPATAFMLMSAALAGGAGMFAVNISHPTAWMIILSTTILLWLRVPEVWKLMNILDASYYHDGSVCLAYDDAAAMNTHARLRSLWHSTFILMVVAVSLVYHELPFGSALSTVGIMIVCSFGAKCCAEYILGCFTPLNNVVCVRR